MTEVEKRENEALKKCLKEAYGYSDEQLQKEMEEAEQSLNDSDFPGAEERIYQKIMEREAAEKKAANTGADANAPDRKKAVRLGKKRVFLVAILAATFVGLLGLTAVGEKSYFFRIREKKTGLVFNNENNIQEISKLEQAYEEIEKKMNIPVLKFGYIPSGMEMDEIVIEEYSADISLDYNGNIIHFAQIRRVKETSISINSDRGEENVIWNDWLKKDIFYRENMLTEDLSEYEGYVTVDEAVYYISRIIDIEEFLKILKNLTFY